MAHYDRVGHDMIRKALEEDLLKARERIDEELSEQFREKVYFGPKGLQEKGREADELRIAQLRKERIEEARKRLEMAHFGEMGEKRSAELSNNEAKIQATQDRWKSQRHDPKSVREPYRPMPGGMRYEFGESKGEEYRLSREEHIAQLKAQWQQDAKDISKSHDRSL